MEPQEQGIMNIFMNIIIGLVSGKIYRKPDAQVAPPVARNAWTAFQRSALLGRPAKPKHDEHDEHDESGNNGGILTGILLI